MAVAAEKSNLRLIRPEGRHSSHNNIDSPKHITEWHMETFPSQCLVTRYDNLVHVPEVRETVSWVLSFFRAMVGWTDTPLPALFPSPISRTVSLFLLAESPRWLLVYGWGKLWQCTLQVEKFEQPRGWKASRHNRTRIPAKSSAKQRAPTGGKTTCVGVWKSTERGMLLTIPNLQRPSLRSCRIDGHPRSQYVEASNRP